MTPDQAIAKVKDLIALATRDGTPETEARNAAMKACRLIVRHEIALSLEPRATSPSESEKEPSPKPLAWLPIDMLEIARLGGRPWCDFHYQGCASPSSWMLATVDRSTITGHYLCDDHLPRDSSSKNGVRRRRMPTRPPPQPFDIAREASDAVGRVGQAVGRRIGSNIAEGVLSYFTKR